MKVYTISTLHDWAHFTGANGPVGIERIFDWLAIARIERVYWRIFEGGLATYPTRVGTPFRGRDVEQWHNLGTGGGPKSEQWAMNEDCSTWDPLATAVRVAQRRGIELCAWWTLCEEDHGGHVGSAFGKQKDHRQQDRDGRDYPGTAELLLPNVQQYRMAVLEEVLERGVDGLLLDFARNNATPSAGPDGIHRFGFNPCIRQAFRDAHGSDPIDLPVDHPDWLTFKNHGRAEFVRKIRSRLGADKHMALMTLPNVDNYRWLCLDLPGLSRDGTVDLVMPFGLSYDNSPQTTAEHVRQLQDQIKGRKTRVAAGVQAYWGMTPDAYEAAIDAAHHAGARAAVLYEADMLSRMNLVTPTRATHLGATRQRRSIEVKRLKKIPTEKDWGRTDHHKGFFIVAGPDRPRASAATTFQILAGPRALHVRIVARGKQENPSAEWLEEKRVYLDWVGARNFWSMSDKAHVFLDPETTRTQYQHFCGGRDGGAGSEMRFKNPWIADWRFAAICQSATAWQAHFALPYKTIGVQPCTGERWGFQIIREQRATREVSSWFVSTAYGVDPTEWGDLVFIN